MIDYEIKVIDQQIKAKEREIKEINQDDFEDYLNQPVAVLDHV